MLRLLRSLRPLRYLMPGKSLNMQSARCHSQQKCIQKLKMLKTEIENGFTFGTFKLFLPKNIFFIFIYHPIEGTKHQKNKN